MKKRDGAGVEGVLEEDEVSAVLRDTFYSGSEHKRSRKKTKKAKPKGWISISCGASVRLNDILPWLPWSTACCVPPNMTLAFTKSFNVNLRWNSRVIILRPGVVRPKPKACGL